MDQMAENTPEVEIETDTSEQMKLLKLMTTNQNRNSTLVTKSWIRQPAKMAQSMDW